MNFADLKKTVKSTVKPCYCCYGDDEYVLSRAVAILSSLADGLPEFNVVDKEFAKGEDLIEELMQLPVMSAYRVVIVRNKIDNATVEKYLSAPNPSSVLVTVKYIPHDSWSHDEAPDVPKGAEAVDCNRLPVKYVYAFVKGIAEKSGATFDEQSITALYRRCGGYMSRINSEAQKLSAMRTGGAVSVSDVETYVEPDEEFVVFELGDCIISVNAARALAVLDGMAKNNDLTAAFTLLYNRFKRMFAAAVDPDGLADLGIKPGMAARLKSESSKIPKARLKRIVDMLADADYAYKSGMMTQYDALSSFVMRASYGGAI